MDALEALFRPIANILNRNIGEITPARELCARLDGKTVVIRVRDTALSLTFGFSNNLIELGTALPEEPDVVIVGSPLTLAKVARGGGQTELRDGSLEVTGNAAVADAFRELLGYAKPDIEEELSGVVGDAAAGRPPFTHAAAHDAAMAVRDMFFPGRGGPAHLVPWCTFTDPELAHAGLTAAQARDKYGAKAVTVYRR